MKKNTPTSMTNTETTQPLPKNKIKNKNQLQSKLYFRTKQLISGVSK